MSSAFVLALVFVLYATFCVHDAIVVLPMTGLDTVTRGIPNNTTEERLHDLFEFASVCKVICDEFLLGYFDLLLSFV